eukprot:556596-Pyramimonas_sp.AAC.1
MAHGALWAAWLGHRARRAHKAHRVHGGSQGYRARRAHGAHGANGAYKALGDHGAHEAHRAHVGFVLRVRFGNLLGGSRVEPFWNSGGLGALESLCEPGASRAISGAAKTKGEYNKNMCFLWDWIEFRCLGIPSGAVGSRSPGDPKNPSL